MADREPELPVLVGAGALHLPPVGVGQGEHHAGDRGADGVMDGAVHEQPTPVDRGRQVARQVLAVDRVATRPDRL